MTATPFDIEPAGPVLPAGSVFNYDIWGPGTEVMLCNVPWDSEYNNVVKFESRAALDKYLETSPGPRIKFNELSYARPEQDVLLDIPLSSAYGYNFMKVTNKETHNDGPLTFYYFVKGVEHVAPQTTAFHLQLDVWSSFQWEVTLGRCYVERGHLSFLVAGAGTETGLKNLLVPEGLDCGADMIETGYLRHRIRHPQSRGDGAYSIVFFASADLTTDPGTTQNPVLNTSKGSNIDLHSTERRQNGEGTVNQYRRVSVSVGADLWFTSADHFVTVMDALKNAPWASRSIMACFIVPLLPESFGGGELFLGRDAATRKLVTGSFTYRQEVTPDITTTMMHRIPARYQHLVKFATHPYSVFELTTYTGSPVILKPELFSGNRLELQISACIIPPNPRTVIYPLNYGRRFRQDPWGGAYLDACTVITEYPQLPITNNSYLDYLASNKNALAFQNDSVNWAQQRAMMGANTAFQQAMMGIDATQQNADLGRDINNRNAGLSRELNWLKSTQQGINAGVGGLSQMASGNLLGGAINGLMGVGNAWMDHQINNISINGRNAIANDELAGRTRISNNLSRGIANSNLSLAKATAAGDARMAIAGINAKVQDAKMLQPSVSGQLGGNFSALINEQGYTVNVRVKTVDQVAVERLGEYWLRYGYALNRYWNATELLPMTNFCYWKMADVTMDTAFMPELYKSTIKGMFLRGVTVWRNPDHIIHLDIADNAPTGNRWGTVVL